MAEYQPQKYKINVINNARRADYANPIKYYVQKIADKHHFNVDVKVKQHKAMNTYLREHNHLAKDHEADGYIPSGGEGHYNPTGKKHKTTDHPHMKRSNRVYEHLAKEGEMLHGVCEGFTAIAQTLGAYAVNSGKLNSNKEEGLRHKYLITKDDGKKLGKTRVSKQKHEDMNYITYFEQGNLSGTQHHPEIRQSPEDEQDIVNFLEKVTGQKTQIKSDLEEKVKGDD